MGVEGEAKANRQTETDTGAEVRTEMKLAGTNEQAGWIDGWMEFAVAAGQIIE